VRKMSSRYRIEIKGHYGEGFKLWTNKAWTAFHYFMKEAPEVTDDPPICGSMKSKLFRGRKLIAEIKSRQGWYPYYVKFSKGLTPEEYEAIQRQVVFDINCNIANRDKYTGTTKIKDWHDYLVGLKK